MAGSVDLIAPQGYLLRNPATNSSTDNLNIYDIFTWRPLIPQSLSSQLAASNCGTISNPIGKHGI